MKLKIRNWKRICFVLIVLILAFAFGVAGYLFQSNMEQKHPNDQADVTAQGDPDISSSDSADNTEATQKPSANSAQSADLKKITADMDTLFAKGTKDYSVGIKLFHSKEQYIGDNKKTPSASVIKVFIMLHAYRMIEKGEVKETNSIKGQSLISLLKSMITVSDNNAANILINYFGMDKINATIKNEGYKSTELQRLMLDTNAQKQGKENYTSISDVMQFLDRMYQNKDKAPYKDMLNLMLMQQVRTKIPLKLPSGTKVANKTGELSGVENDIGIVFTDKGDYAIAVLTNNDTNTEAARLSIATLSKNVYDYVSGHLPAGK